MYRKIRQVSDCCNAPYERLPYDEEWGERYICKICKQYCCAKQISIKDETDGEKNRS
jgi:hypothetical protein